MPKGKIGNWSSSLIGQRRYSALLMFGVRERFFLRILAALLFLTAVFYVNVQVAMWLGFLVASYSVVANDSIQTIGTFIVSNSDKKWYVLWLFIGLLFVGTVTYSWITYGGDVSFQRLSNKGFSETPTQFYFLQIAAPILLLLLTRLRVPVSTTFILLSVFSSSSDGIIKVAEKSFLGYVISFITAFLVYFMLRNVVQRFSSTKAPFIWTVLQWLISGTLWCMWIMHDAANIAIFLPRSLSLVEFIAFAGVIFVGLGLLFYLRGDKMQRIVSEKSGVEDVRAATIVDLVYTVILIVFINLSTIPMSTTWVFIGLLGGREIALSFGRRKSQGRSTRDAVLMMGKDVLLAGTGLVVSIVLALLANETLFNEIKVLLFGS